MDYRLGRFAVPCLCFLFLLLSVPAAYSADGGQASGRFESRELAMEIKDAYAFAGTPSLGGKEKVIVVVVSNQGFVKAALDEYWDRRTALERYFKDDKTGLVYFEFSPAGKYRGLSYYFGPGNGCGYCADPAVQSSIELKNGRLAGKLRSPKGTDPDRWFDVTLNVSVSSDDHGTAQGAGGGEVGKAYLSYHRALSGRDEQTIRNSLSEERRKVWSDAAAKGNGAAFLNFLREDHPRDVKVTQAYVRSGKALVLFEGKGASGPVRGEAHFSLEHGSWRFDEETVQAASK